MLTFSGKREALFECLAVLNTCSDGTEVAGMQRYFLASAVRSGNFDWLFLHQSRGSPSSASNNAYFCTSRLAFSFGSTGYPGASAWPMTSLSNDIIPSRAFLGFLVVGGSMSTPSKSASSSASSWTDLLSHRGWEMGGFWNEDQGTSSMICPAVKM